MDLICKMLCLLVLQMYFTFPISTGFLFDMVADDHQCKSSSMLCPPMCQRRDSNGCISCSCGTGFDPSHPEHMPNLLDSQTGSKPQQSDQKTTTKAVTTLSLHMTSAQLQASTLQQTNGQTNIPITSAVNIFSSSSLYPQTSSSALTQTTAASSAPSFTDHSTIGPKTTVFDTKLPVLATAPQPSGGLSTSTRATTTTMAAFQCPGVFNCTKDCYTGYKMDNNGCPLCECAPMPTDLP